MSNTFETDESMSNSSSFFKDVIISSTESLGGYVVYEPNYRFTKFENIKLVSQSNENGKSIFLYNLRLPCEFNPFIYIFFEQVEAEGYCMLGDVNIDSIIFVSNCTSDNLKKYQENTLNQTGLESLRYSISESGDLYLGEPPESETEFFLRKYKFENENSNIPFFYHNDKDLSCQIKIVYKNEIEEYNIAESCYQYTTSIQPKHTIFDFTSSMCKHFLNLFKSVDENQEMIDYIRLIYQECFQNMSPRKIFNTIGKILLSGGPQNDLLDEHFIVNVDLESKQKRILKAPSKEMVTLFRLQFKPNSIRVFVKDTNSTEINVKHQKFKYEFILPP